MGKEKFIYNTQTLRYEKVEEPLRAKVLRALGFLSAVLVFAIIIVSIAFTYLDSPKEKILKRELEQMKIQYDIVNEEINRYALVLDNIQERDANVHRMMFGMDPIDDGVWEGGIGGRDKYAHLYSANTDNVMASTMQRLDKLKRQLALQSTSLDTIELLVKEKDKMLSSIPSIKPVREDKLARNMNLLSGFGYRIHPIHRVPRMHKGIDFTSPSGTPIYATGDGVVSRIERKRTGYGHNVKINHGYGYETLYAHMSKILVKPGQKIKKGQKIGLVGSTGTSTAPHLHYEVHYKGVARDPILYCMDELEIEEYQELVERSSIKNHSFD